MYNQRALWDGSLHLAMFWFLAMFFFRGVRACMLACMFHLFVCLSVWLSADLFFSDFGSENEFESERLRVKDYNENVPQNVAIKPW